MQKISPFLWFDGQAEVAANPYVSLHHSFTEAVSFFVRCKDQAEGGQENQCGWLKDRFGLSWQILPDRLGELLGDPDPGRSQRAMQAMLQMRKIDVQALEDAADGTG